MSAMEKAIGRWIIVMGALAVLFALAALFTGGELREAGIQGEELLPMCRYIEIDVQKANVELIPYDGDEIRFSYRNDVPFYAELSENGLLITESDKFVVSVLAGDRSQFGLYLYLPREEYGSIRVYTASGSVRVEDTDYENLTVITGSGDISVSGAASPVFLTTASGSITLDFEEIAEGSSIQSRTGNARLLLPHIGSAAIDFETETGRVETDLFSGSIEGSYMYSFNGGANLIHAELSSGVLTIVEKSR